jgi:DNA-binding NtrC family response regulator
MDADARVNLELVGDAGHQAGANRACVSEPPERSAISASMPSRVGHFLIGDAPAMRSVVELIAKVAPSSLHVLITGEPGTGKSATAAAIHALSPRASKPLIVLRAGEVPLGQFARRLRGAETDDRGGAAGVPAAIDLAAGGTLMLDEVADVPLDCQPSLLRLLESGTFERCQSCVTRRSDMRLLVSTSVDLQHEVWAGRFQRDLLARLRMVVVQLPALRDRRADIPQLADHFRVVYAARHRRRVFGFDSSAVDALMQHSWPGNVRELERAVECAVLLARRTLITSDDLALRAWSEPSRRLEDLTLQEAQRLLITRALARFNGNVRAAARALGLTTFGLNRLLRLQRAGWSQPDLDARRGRDDRIIDGMGSSAVDHENPRAAHPSLSPIDPFSGDTD